MTRPEAIRQIESPIEREPKRAKVPRQVCWLRRFQLLYLSRNAGSFNIR